MKQPLSLSLALTLTTLLPLQTVYADGLSPTKVTSQPIPSSAVSVSTNPSTTPATIPTVQGAITTTPGINSDQAQDLIQITQASIPLSSKLQKSYEAYKITVQNNYPGTLYLQSAAVNNAQSGAMAAELVKASMTPVYMTLLLGGAGFILIGVPMLIVKNGHNEKARQEALPYTNQIPLVELPQGQLFTVQVLVPLGQKPDISLNFKDRQSGLLICKRAI